MATPNSMMDSKAILAKLAQLETEFSPNSQPPLVPSHLRAAAVLVPIIDRDNHLSVLFTRRSERLSDHAGQISFPGGCCEAGDRNRAATALREAYEEINLLPDYITVVGAFESFSTGTGFHISPIVGIVAGTARFIPNPSEVAEIIEAPLDYLLARENYQINSIETNNGRRDFYEIYVDNHRIWGATAHILIMMREYLMDSDSK